MWEIQLTEGHFPGTSLLRHVLPIDAALVDQDRVVVLHTRQKTPVGRRDAARLGAFVSARNERGFWTAIPPLKGEGKNSAAAGNFFLFRPFKRKRNLLCSRRILELRFGGSYLGEILLLFKLPCFPTVKFAAAVNPNDFVNSQLEFSGNEKEVPNHACFSHII